MTLGARLRPRQGLLLGLGLALLLVGAAHLAVEIFLDHERGQAEAAAYVEAGLEPLPMPYQTMVSTQVTVAALAAGRADVWGGFAGQGLGMVRAVRPAAAVMQDLVAGAEQVLGRAGGFIQG